MIVPLLFFSVITSGRSADIPSCIEGEGTDGHCRDPQSGTGQNGYALLQHQQSPKPEVRLWMKEISHTRQALLELESAIAEGASIDPAPEVSHTQTTAAKAKEWPPHWGHTVDDSFSQQLQQMGHHFQGLYKKLQDLINSKHEASNTCTVQYDQANARIGYSDSSGAWENYSHCNISLDSLKLAAETACLNKEEYCESSLSGTKPEVDSIVHDEEPNRLLSLQEGLVGHWVGILASYEEHKKKCQDAKDLYEKTKEECQNEGQLMDISYCDAVAQKEKNCEDYKGCWSTAKYNLAKVENSSQKWSEWIDKKWAAMQETAKNGGHGEMLQGIVMPVLDKHVMADDPNCTSEIDTIPVDQRPDCDEQ